MARPQSKKEVDPHALEQMVNELMKDQPNKLVLKKLAAELGIPYSVDSMTQINTVLHSVSASSLRKELER
jgi:hypothetical protein